MADELVSISIEGWVQKGALYVEKLGVTVHEFLDEEWPLLLRKVMDFTPPFVSGGSTGVSDLSVGRAAVSRDIQKTMRPFDPTVVRSKQLKKVLDERDIAVFNLIASRAKRGPMVMRAVAFSQAVHRSQRNARGRVGKTLGNVVIGRDVEALRNYILHMERAVGIAKSGWWSALSLVGGEAPAYVTRHGRGEYGGYIDDRKNIDEPSITAINRTPWAVRRDEGERILTAAYASRAVALRSKIRTKLRLAAEQATLNLAAG